MSDAINTTVSKTLDERSERAATQPKVDLPDDQDVINKVLDGDADLSFDVSYEVLPPVTLMDFKGLKVDKPIVRDHRRRYGKGSRSACLVAAARLRGKGRRWRPSRPAITARPELQVGKIEGEAFAGRHVGPCPPRRGLGRLHPRLRRAAGRHEEGRDSRPSR
jgi:hypothetical protein